MAYRRLSPSESVKDPAILTKLNEKLIEAFKNKPMDLVLAYPDIIDYSESVQYSYSGAGKNNTSYESVYIDNYREYLEKNNVTVDSVNTLKSHKLNVQDENNTKKDSHSIYKSLLFDYELNKEYFHLCEGEWYQVEKNYIEKIKINLDKKFTTINWLPKCNQYQEGEYNKKVGEDENIICLDRKNIAPNGQTAVEPCDLIRIENDTAQLVHIKISTRSSSLSHLFNQGVNSVELLKLNEEAKNSLISLLRKPKLNSKFKTSINAGNYAVIYGIITAKDALKKSDCLPLFSRISLLRTLNQLKLMSIPAHVVLIKDEFNRKTK